MIRLSNISKSFGDKEVLKNINLEVYDGDHIGIVGYNGAGKSTLLNIMTGVIVPDSGSISLGDNSIGFLKQSTEYSSEDFLFLSQDKDFIREFMRLKSIMKIRDDIDFTEDRLKVLSGGERSKLMLAKIVSFSPSVLLFDEPTNHLDAETKQWLIDFINSYEGTAIIISHDRQLLNSCVYKIWEIENCSVNEYIGGYDEYQNAKDFETKQLLDKYDTQEKNKKKIKQQIDRLAKWSDKASKDVRKQGGKGSSDSRLGGRTLMAERSAAKVDRAVQAKKSCLEKSQEDAIARPQEMNLNFGLEKGDIKAKVLVKVTDLSKSYGDTLLYKDVDFVIERGAKIALKGVNGTGKTVLINMLFGREPLTSGVVWCTPSLNPFLLSQDVFDMQYDCTIKEYAIGLGKEKTTLFLTSLATMNFSKDMFYKKIKSLSLGEKMRIKLCEVMLSRANLIVLDEPTNHLDIPNKIHLEKVLRDYQGALLIVSHDVYFINSVANAELVIENKKITYYEL